MSKKIIGVTVGTTLPKPNFKQTDPTKGDYIKNKPDFEGLKTKVSTLEEFVGDEKVSEQIANALVPLNAKIEELLYEAISITSFTNNVGTVEIGSTVSSVKLTWATNKTPTTLTLDGTSMDTSLTTYTYNDLNLTSGKTYKLVVTDEKEASAEKTTSVSFVNGIYYGAIDTNANIDSATILAMSKKLQNSRGVTFTVTPGATEHLAYALPTRLGTPTFTVGVLQGGFFKKATIDFTNASGYTESYDVYFSTNANLGTTKVVVS